MTAGCVVPRGDVLELLWRIRDTIPGEARRRTGRARLSRLDSPREAKNTPTLWSVPPLPRRVVVSHARAEADRLLADAKSQADRMVSEARRYSERMASPRHPRQGALDKWNGMEWNGMEWMEWNGRNGMEWNGMEWNGMEWYKALGLGWATSTSTRFASGGIPTHTAPETQHTHTTCGPPREPAMTTSSTQRSECWGAPKDRDHAVATGA